MTVAQGPARLPAFPCRKKGYGQSLTTIRETPTLTGMRSARGVVAVLTVALAAYGLDCMGMATPQHAKGCCEKMRCHSHHHRNPNPEDCCKTTPQLQAALAQPSSMQPISVSPVTLGVIQVSDNPKISEFCASIFAEHSHDPPLSSPVSNLPLRI